MIRHISRQLLVLAMILTCSCAGETPTKSQPIVEDNGKTPYSGEPLHQLMKRVMAYQVKAYETTPRNMWINWQAAPFWAGVMASYQSTGDEVFYAETKKWAEANQWKVNRRTFHADDIAVGQAYLDIYLKDKRPEMLADLKSRLDQYLTKESVTRVDVAHGTDQPIPFTGRNVWWWCDALFMAPPVMTRLSAATGDKRYTELMHKLYWDCTDYLFDPTEGLYFRDDSFFFDKKQSPTGKKIFWSRGNGWVYAGLIRTLDYLPKDDPQRQRYIDLFKKMTEAIVKYQGEDGLWRSSLNDPSWVPERESSGTGFFTYGLLAGINRGYLDRKTYLPRALRGWRGLCSVINPDGSVGFTQPVGSSPVPPTAESVKDYSQGAFLLAASELDTLKPTLADLVLASLKRL